MQQLMHTVHRVIHRAWPQFPLVCPGFSTAVQNEYTDMYVKFALLFGIKITLHICRASCIYWSFNPGTALVDSPINCRFLIRLTAAAPIMAALSVHMAREGK